MVWELFPAFVSLVAEEIIGLIFSFVCAAERLYNCSGMGKVEPIANYRLTEHALEEMARRQISQDDVASVLAAPEQIEPVRQGRNVYQSRIEVGKPPQKYLLRVFVDVDREPPQVVTAYRTSKVTKYWRVDT